MDTLKLSQVLNTKKAVLELVTPTGSIKFAHQDFNLGEIAEIEDLGQASTRQTVEMLSRLLSRRTKSDPTEVKAAVEQLLPAQLNALIAALTRPAEEALENSGKPTGASF
jgi:hypothetical protein